MAAPLPPLSQVLLLGASLLSALVLAADVVLLRVLKVSWRIGRILVRWTWRQAADSASPESPRKRAAVRPPEEPAAEEETAVEDEEVPAPPALPTAGARSIPIRYHDRLDAAHATPARPTDSEQFAGYELPPLTLLEDPEPLDHGGQDQLLRERASQLEKTFADFGLKVHVVGINTGPVITQYEVALETGLRVHKVTRLADDIALN